MCSCGADQCFRFRRTDDREPPQVQYINKTIFSQSSCNGKHHPPRQDRELWSSSRPKIPTEWHALQLWYNTPVVMQRDVYTKRNSRVDCKNNATVPESGGDALTPGLTQKSSQEELRGFPHYPVLATQRDEA